MISVYLLLDYIRSLFSVDENADFGAIYHICGIAPRRKMPYLCTCKNETITPITQKQVKI